VNPNKAGEEGSVEEEGECEGQAPSNHEIGHSVQEDSQGAHNNGGDETDCKDADLDAGGTLVGEEHGEEEVTGGDEGGEEAEGEEGQLFELEAEEAEDQPDDDVGRHPHPLGSFEHLPQCFGIHLRAAAHVLSCGYVSGGSIASEGGDLPAWCPDVCPVTLEGHGEAC